MKKISKEFKGDVISPYGYLGELVIGNNIGYIHEDEHVISISSRSKNEENILKYLHKWIKRNKHVNTWVLKSFDKLYGVKYTEIKTRNSGFDLKPNKILKNAHIKITIERLD